MRNCLARSSEPPAAEATASCAPQYRCPKQTNNKNNIKQIRIFNSLLPAFVAPFYAPLPNPSNKRPDTYHFPNQYPPYIVIFTALNQYISPNPVKSAIAVCHHTTKIRPILAPLSTILS
jgi:hypothetical protein